MFGKMLASALFAGLAGGLVAAFLQVYLMVPVILEAELYESGIRVHNAESALPPGERQAAEDAARATAEAEAFARNFATFLATTAAYTGFALLMVAGFALARRSGIEVGARSGILWGMGGFVAFQLAPALGLPAELPGASAAALPLRQLWWSFAVVATLGGIIAIAFGRTLPLQLVGVGLLALPVLVPAPHPAEYGGVVPPELATLFAGRALAVGAATWAVLGFFAGHFWSRSRLP